MKPRVTALLCVMLVMSVRGAVPTASIEKQFRADIEMLIRASWPPSKIRDDAVAKTVEETVSEAKSTAATLFAEYAHRDVPKDDALQQLYVRLLKMRGEEDLRQLPPLLSFYAERMESKSLTPVQKILFARNLQIAIDARQKTNG